MKKALSIVGVVLLSLLALGAALCLILRKPIGRILSIGYEREATLYARAGHNQVALARFDEAIRSDPSNVNAFTHRAAVDYFMGSYKDAVEDASRAIGLDKNRAEAWAWRGLAHARLNEAKLSYGDLSRAIQLKPGAADYIMARAGAAMVLGNFKAAMADADQAVKLEPKNPMVFDDRAQIERAMDDLSAANRDEVEAVDLAPKSAQFLANLAWLRILAEDYDGALNYAGRACQLDRKNLRAIFIFGVAQERGGFPELANGTFLHLLNLDPYYDARYQLALAKYDAGKINYARAQFDQTKAYGSAKEKARLWLWILDTETGHSADADRQLAEWVDGKESIPFSLARRLGEVFLRRQSLSALQVNASMVDRPGKRRNEFGEIWFFAGEAALAKGDHELAEECFQKAVDSKATLLDEYTEAQRELKKLNAPSTSPPPIASFPDIPKPPPAAPTADIPLLPFNSDSSDGSDKTEDDAK